MAIARCQNCGKPEGRRQTYVSRAFVPQSWQVARFTMVSHLTPFCLVQARPRAPTRRKSPSKSAIPEVVVCVQPPERLDR